MLIFLNIPFLFSLLVVLKFLNALLRSLISFVSSFISLLVLILYFIFSIIVLDLFIINLN